MAAAAEPAANPNAQDLRSLVPSNPFAFIPPQCYTRTERRDGSVHNPCYACHVSSAPPNYVDDQDVTVAAAAQLQGIALRPRSRLARLQLAAGAGDERAVRGP
jgi:hypothetical protein